MLSAKTDAAHKRIDTLERGIREDLKEIKADLKILTERINIGRGWAAASLALASIVGALITKLLGFLFT